MSFMFYSKDGTMNIVADLTVLELVNCPAAVATYAPIQSAGKWDMVLSFTSQTIATGGKITVTVRNGEQGRYPLKDAPEALRERITRILTPFAHHLGRKLPDVDVEIVCL